MEKFKAVKSGGKNVVSIRAYKGDAMTFLAFDLDKSMLDGFAGFSIHVKFGNKKGYYLFNRLAFKKEILAASGIDDDEKLSSEFSPFQKFNWVHVPSTNHNLDKPFFGNYTYSITPRFLKKNVLAPLNKKLTASVTIDVSPFVSKGTSVGFARAFVSSQAYATRFGMNNQMRPKGNDLMFDVMQDVAVKPPTKPYTYEAQHKYLGWQARERVMDFLDETLKNKKMSLDIFAYDLNEPVIVQKLIELAKQGRLRIILDNAGEHGKKNSYENQFEDLFKKKAKKSSVLARGHFISLSHSKIFIQKSGGTPKKVLTGSTNFSTNGIYVNANHVVIFDNKAVAKLYEDMFEASLGQELMDKFKVHDLAITDHVVKQKGMPDMTIRFSPHNKTVAQTFFDKISTRINSATSDVLFAIMKDTSKSGILEAIENQVKKDKVFTYGITDSISAKTGYSVSLYKPNSKKGIRVAGKGGSVRNILPKPFDTVPKIDGYSIHHKFVVVDFKGKDPTVYCGSSNLAFGPEQANGDNLLEIRDRDITTAFAIEALRLVDHFHWRNTKAADAKELNLDDLKDKKEIWYKRYYSSKDIRCLERVKFISEPAKK